MKSNTVFFLLFIGFSVGLYSVQAKATDLGVGSSMQCELVSKNQKVSSSRSTASDLGKLKTFNAARKSCNKDYPGSYPVNIKTASSNTITFDCQSCFTFAKNESENFSEDLNDENPQTITGKDPEEAWLSTVAEAR
jgi:hypothetical protein